MHYNYTNLSSIDFEDLARDLIGKEMGCRFEAFCPGPDNGIDGRHSLSPGSAIILQAKHYEGSTFSKLKNTMRRERASIDQLNPSRYVLVTTCGITPSNKNELAKIIGHAVQNENDIYGVEDIDGLLRKYPEILKSHIKLWLSDSAVLERVLRAASHTFTAMTHADILRKVKVYAQNPSFDVSREKLEQHHVLIVSGPPGVGKTTLAEMLAWAYMGNGWELVSIRSLEDGLEKIDDSKNRVFFFDDFLGTVDLDHQALSRKDSLLAKFMRTVRESPNARFILTTRAYIFEEARTVSEHLADKQVDISKYVLDVGIYARSVKARILYNHLAASTLPQSFINALIRSGKLPSIVDHESYNPRVVEWMTDYDRLKEIAPEAYAKTFIDGLDDPSQLWEIAFKKHIDDKCRHVLVVLYFCSEYGVSIRELQPQYESTHAYLCQYYSQGRDPKDFEEALKILEGSFISIHGDRVSYLNPSIRDYLGIYLRDSSLLVQLAPTAVTGLWAEALWDYAIFKLLLVEIEERLAMAFVSLTSTLVTRPVWAPTPKDASKWEKIDLYYSHRLKLLLGWWRASGDTRFSTCMIEIARQHSTSFSIWSDSNSLFNLLHDITSPNGERALSESDELREIIEGALVSMIRYQTEGESLYRIAKAADSTRANVPSSIKQAINVAVVEEFEEIETRTLDETSISDLNERKDALVRLASLHDIPADKLSRAVEVISERVAKLERENSTTESPQFENFFVPSEFDDSDLHNLFQGLLADHEDDEKRSRL